MSSLSISSGLRSPTPTSTGESSATPPSSAGSEPSPTTTPKVAATELPTEIDESESGGSIETTTATSSRITSNTSSFSLKSRSFGFAPLASMFRSRSSGGTLQKPSVNTNTNTRNAEDVLEDPGLVLADTESNVTGDDNRVDDDEDDDRRTIRGGVTESTPATPVGAHSRMSFNLENESEDSDDDENDVDGRGTKEDLRTSRETGKVTGAEGGGGGGGLVNGHGHVVGLTSEKEGIIERGNDETTSTMVDTTTVPHVR